MHPTLLTHITESLPSPIYKILARKWIDYKFPRHLHIEVTQKCQLSCDFCPRPKQEGDMSYDTFKRIINEASFYGPRSFSLHLFGDPLLWEHLFEGIQYIKQKNKRHAVLITTNGILLNEYADRLLQCGVDKIIWTYRRLGGNSFTSDTITKLKKVAVLRILKETMQEEDWENSKKIKWKRQIKSLHNYGGSLDINNFTGKRYPCYHLWFAPAIRWNGDFTICCNDPYGKAVVGNLRSDCISSLWNSVIMKTERKCQLKCVYTGICINCDVWKTYPNIW